jgi:ABC-2 type transport system permease protein
VLLSAINVKLRDTQHLLEVALQVWFWATPIVYQYRLVLARIAGSKNSLYHVLFWVWRLNPVTPIVLTFQRAIYGQTSPTGLGGARVAILPDHAQQWWYLWQILLVAAGSFLVLIFGAKVFGRLEGNFAEEL